jgi:hypothetical protein
VPTDPANAETAATAEEIADDGPLLSQRREEVIFALLSTRTRREAAKKAGLTERRLYRLLSEDEFKAAYVKARRDAYQCSVAQLSPLVEDAVQTLRKAMNCQQWPVRVRAAVAILDKGYQWIQSQDFEDRLLGVERTLGIVKDERIAGEQGLHAVDPERLQKLDEMERAELNELRREKLKASGRWKEPDAADDTDSPDPTDGA